MAALVSEAEIKGMVSDSKVHVMLQDWNDGTVKTTDWIFV